MKTNILIGLGLTVWATCMTLLVLDAAEPKPDPPKLCTLKLTDSNDVTSYITGPNQQ